MKRFSNITNNQKEKEMKKKMLIAVAVSALSATSAFAAITVGAGAGVLGSVHDMNNVGGGIAKDNQGRVCAFCHTPHHAIDSTDPNAGDYMPLWSHKLTTQGFTQYDSGTFDAGKVGNIEPLAGPTRLCMSCHDGEIAPDQHYGGANTGNKFTGNEFVGLEWQIGIGAAGALNRTHPIGFNLADAIAADTAGSNAGSVNSGFVDGIATGTFFKGSTTKTIQSQLYNGIMTCATCHDVHNKDNVVNVINAGVDAEHTDTIGRNYLVFARQSGSELCLSCHNK